jgi:hypothetical protein
MLYDPNKKDIFKYSTNKLMMQIPNKEGDELLIGIIII